MTKPCSICGGDVRLGPLPCPNICGFCAHIWMERDSWLDDIESALSQLRDGLTSLQAVEEVVSRHETVLPALAEHIWSWNVRSITDPLDFRYLRSLRIPRLDDALEYLESESHAVRFLAILNAEENEIDVSRFLDENHRALVSAVAYVHSGEGAYCLREFSFGRELFSDFLILIPRRSLSPTIALVELEPVRDSIFTKKGTPSQRLLMAMHQIKEWRTWIESNPAAFRKEVMRRLGGAVDPIYFERSLRQQGMDFQGYIFLGRRTDISSQDNRHLWNSRGEISSVHTYDSILEILLRQDLELLHYEGELETRSLVQRLRTQGFTPRKKFNELFEIRGQFT